MTRLEMKLRTAKLRLVRAVDVIAIWLIGHDREDVAEWLWRRCGLMHEYPSR